MSFIPKIPQTTRTILRLREVQAVLLRYGFDFVFDQKELRAIRFALAQRSLKPNLDVLKRSFPERMRLMLQELGPTYIKLGQILSSRRDLLPAEYAKELSKLQDQIPSFPYEQVRKIIQDDFGVAPEVLFQEFDQEPFAAASIGQVHRAVLLSGDEVVVKVQRPNIKQTVRSDMEIIKAIVRMVEGATDWGKRYGLSEIFKEFERTLKLEMDFRNEASNADRLRRICAREAHARAPFVYWNYTSDRILTMEYVHGVKVNDLESIDAAGIDRGEIAKIFIRSVFSQLLIEGFFHADPHPGNLFIDLENQDLVFIDLGMMGSMVKGQRLRLQDLIFSIIRRDSEDVTRLVLTIGTPFAKVDESSLLRSVDHIINRYLDTTLDRIELSTLLEDVLATIFEHNIRLPSELSLAIKTIVQGEEVAHMLAPDISVIKIAETVSSRIWKEKLDPQNMVDITRDIARETARMQKILPRAIESILTQLQTGKLTVSVDIPKFNWIINTMVIVSNRLVAGLVITGMLIGAALVMGNTNTHLGAVLEVIGLIGFSVAVVLGGMLVWSVIIEIGRSEKNKKEED